MRLKIRREKTGVFLGVCFARLVTVLSSLIIFGTSAVGAEEVLPPDKPTKRSNRRPAPAVSEPARPALAKGDDRFNSCELLLDSAPIARYGGLTQSWDLLDLINPDPKDNLAARFPTILMNNAQLDWYVANFYPRHKVKDPAYRRSEYDYYPMISAGVPETNYRQVIGHYETISRAMNYIRDKAHGKRASKMLGFLGGAGTGKTELGILLENAKVTLANQDPAYFQYTFEFHDLDKIPYLAPLTYGFANPKDSPAIRDLSLNRSPLVLLPPRLQAEVVRRATPQFREFTKAKSIEMLPRPFTHASLKTQAVLDAIVRHYVTEERQSNPDAVVTDLDYMRYIGRHVRIVRRLYDNLQPPAIIRFVGKNPDMTSLFFSENLALSQIYGLNNPLSYNYGLIPLNDGKGIFVDEFFRQESEVRDSFLDLAQNQTAQNGGGPAEYLNSTIYFSSNDESISDAQADGGAKAHLSRTNRLAMRNAIEPWLAVKIALMDIGRDRFSMRPIEHLPDSMAGEKTAGKALVRLPELVPYQPQEVIPDDVEGQAIGSDGRYALYYHSAIGVKDVLIAPRSLWMLGLVAAGSRIVTDPVTIANVNKDRVLSTIVKYPQYFTSDKDRLHVLNGDKLPNRTVLGELQKARDILKEGLNGIGAREIENWLSYALQLASDRKSALTPRIIDEAFEKLIYDESIPATAKQRADWINLIRMIKTEFILPMLTEDVINIVQGRGRAEGLYADVRKELMAISADTEAHYVEGEGNDHTPIDRERLNEIFAIFQELTNKVFEVGMLKDFHLNVNPNAKTKQHPELMKAVRRYLAKRELDKTVMTELVQYFDGQDASEAAQEIGARAELQLERYGYDKDSFNQALRLVRDLSYDLEKNRLAPPTQ